MTGFRVLLVVLFAVVVIYTIPVVTTHGVDLLSVFFGDIARMGWPGQFNLDFLGFLILSAFWLAWRHHFAPAGLGLGVLGFFGGIPMLTLYLMVVSFTSNGDVAIVLLGKERAAAMRSRSVT